MRKIVVPVGYGENCKYYSFDYLSRKLDSEPISLEYVESHKLEYNIAEDCETVKDGIIKTFYGTVVDLNKVYMTAVFVNAIVAGSSVIESRLVHITRNGELLDSVIKKEGVIDYKERYLPLPLYRMYAENRVFKSQCVNTSINEGDIVAYVRKTYGIEMNARSDRRLLVRDHPGTALRMKSMCTREKDGSARGGDYREFIDWAIDRMELLSSNGKASTKDESSEDREIKAAGSEVEAAESEVEAAEGEVKTDGIEVESEAIETKTEDTEVEAGAVEARTEDTEVEAEENAVNADENKVETDDIKVEASTNTDKAHEIEDTAKGNGECTGTVEVESNLSRGESTEDSEVHEDTPQDLQQMSKEDRQKALRKMLACRDKPENHGYNTKEEVYRLADIETSIEVKRDTALEDRDKVLAMTSKESVEYVQEFYKYLDNRVEEALDNVRSGKKKLEKANEDIENERQQLLESKRIIRERLRESDSLIKNSRIILGYLEEADKVSQKEKEVYTSYRDRLREKENSLKAEAQRLRDIELNLFGESEHKDEIERLQRREADIESLWVSLNERELNLRNREVELSRRYGTLVVILDEIEKLRIRLGDV